MSITPMKRKPPEMSNFKPLKLDIGIAPDPFDDDDFGYFRGPKVHRQKGESYDDFRNRVKVEAQSLVDLYNTIPAMRKLFTRLQNRVTELETKLENTND